MESVERAQYVERWARALESQGQSRIAGRVYGHLATAPEPYLSLQDLADQLGVSRASISTNTRRLVDLGLVSRVPVPGSRGEHYCADPAAARGLVAGLVTATRDLEHLSREGIDLVEDQSAPGARSLQLLAELYGRMGAALEATLAGVADEPARS
ncbi:unannotated protein [freshwater metagenome]|uniref:Unannotated protein n=1 Tax=freshwater metagenome TaxID=449393 RepID=A0A6J6PBK8_9ZZZZ